MVKRLLHHGLPQSQLGIKLLVDFNISKRIVYHLRRLGIYCYFRKSIKSYFKQRTERGQKISDRMILRFARNKDYVVVTRDWGMYQQGIERGTPVLYVPATLKHGGVWATILRILAKTEHPLFKIYQLGAADLRLWFSMDSGTGKLKRTQEQRKSSSVTDETYNHVWC